MKNLALKFVLLIGVISFFADFVYEGARSVTGPCLAVLGASATLVGVIAGLGELLGYGLRLVTGPLSERTGQFWPITIFGYVVQMAAVPLLAWAPSWQLAGLLIVLERVGKAIRNPPRDVMLSHASKDIGLGFGFGLHEAMDQAGALIGPLVVAFILARHGTYRGAFAVLLVPAILTRSEEHTSELQSQSNLVCRLLLEKKQNYTNFTEQERPASLKGGHQPASL